MKKISPLLIMIAVSVGFNLMLVAVRVLLTGELQYANYFWNTFLAVLPLCFAHNLSLRQKTDVKSALLFILWLVFFPNAPYLVTDFIHFEPRPGYSKWADILLVTTASWNGVVIGVISLMKTEKFLGRHFSKNAVLIFNVVAIFLCGYGIYLGRFLRYNSWDIITSPFSLGLDLLNTIILPHEHLRTWMFTLLFGTMFGIFYFTIRLLSAEKMQDIKETEF
jgi:uncharacterized membrane protein